jgi:hypothetical protein
MPRAHWLQAYTTSLLLHYVNKVMFRFHYSKDMYLDGVCQQLPETCRT